MESFPPDDLRRNVVSRLLDADVDIAVVAKVAGNISKSLTMASETFTL